MTLPVTWREGDKVRYKITGDRLTQINLAPETEAEEIEQNLLVILSSVEGTIPLARGLGISSRFMHSPIAADGIQALMIVDIMEKIQRYEPRAEFISAEFEEDHENGTLMPIVEVEF